MKTFKPSVVWRVLVAVLLFLPGLTLAFLSVTLADGKWIMVPIALVLCVGGAALWVLIGRAEISVDDRGVRKRGVLGGASDLAFADVADYRYQVVSSHGTENAQIILNGKNGRVVKVTSAWRDVFELIELVVERVEPLLIAPAFGPITLEPDAIVYKDKRVPLTEVSGVGFDGVRLTVRRQGKLLAAIAVGGLKVPNLFLLLDALRARGLDAPDARPWRVGVSVVGFQEPKR